jgi:hypothetical protein
MTDKKRKRRRKPRPATPPKQKPERDDTGLNRFLILAFRKAVEQTGKAVAAIRVTAPGDQAIVETISNDSKRHEYRFCM